MVQEKDVNMCVHFFQKIYIYKNIELLVFGLVGFPFLKFLHFFGFQNGREFLFPSSSGPRHVKL